MKVLVVGHPDAVLGFSLVGIDGATVQDADELTQVLGNALADKTIGLVLVTADVAQFSRVRIDRLKVTSLEPLVVEVPGEGVSTSIPSLKEFVQRAIGVNLGGG